ncbi:hypothetical protein [Niallia sp. 01092]|uniref:hypothetical protein n=1 Tax=unclassified Niallia TaxID=2837522 RepID=UPI003FD0909A
MKIKKALGGILTFGVLMLFGFNAYASSSFAQIDSSNPDASGSQVYCGDHVMDSFWANNDSSIDYYAYIMQEITGPNKSVHTRTVGDNQEIYESNIWIVDKDDYYVRAKWTGEAGLYYLQGAAGMESK